MYSLSKRKFPKIPKFKREMNFEDN